jgi:hypothetical protein
LREVEAPTFSDIQLTDGGKVVSPTRRPLFTSVKTSGTHCKVKVKLSLYRPWRPLGLREVEAPTFSDIQLRDGDKVVSTTRRPLFTSMKTPGTHFC